MISALLVKHLNVSQAAATAIKYAVFSLAVFGLVKGFANHNYKKGVSDCEAAQTKVDNEVSTLIPGFQLDLGKSSEEKEIERVEIIKEYSTGITTADLDSARAEGIAEGARDGRIEVYEELRQNGGCLAIAYQPRDRLQINAAAQQQRFIQSGIGSFEITTTKTELSKRGSEANTISKGLAGEYPQPDRSHTAGR